MVNNISIGVGYPRGALHVLKGTAFELSPYAVLCTRVYTVVYTRVHCCIHACTQRRSLLLRSGALFYSMDGLLFTLRMSSPRLARRARASSTAGLPLLLPYPPINNVPACEGIGNLRCDLELWGEMHYLCRRKSKRGGAQQARRTRRERRREGRDVCEKNLRRSLVVRKKAVPLQPQNERRVAGSDCDHDDV